MPVIPPATTPAMVPRAVAASGVHLPHEEGRDDGRPHPERPVGGEIERVVDAVADEDAEGERREDEADRRRSDQQIHDAVLRRPG